jgi:predicted deacylase
MSPSSTSVTDLGAGRTRRFAPITTLASGFQLGLTIHVVQGSGPGPTVGVSAMIHGDELDGLLVARELVRTLDPSTMHGAVWILGVANPLAMEGVSRNTPLDMLDMNRLFPGAPDGWLSEQQAHAIAHEFIDHLDFLIDLHCGGTFPWVDYCYVVNDEELSRAFLPALLYEPATPYPGTTATYAEEQGVRCMVVEIGGGYHDQPTHVANGVRGVLNQLRYAGVLEGEVERRPGQVLMRDMKVMRPRHGGICVPHGPGRHRQPLHLRDAGDDVGALRPVHRRPLPKLRHPHPPGGLRVHDGERRDRDAIRGLMSRPALPALLGLALAAALAGDARAQEAVGAVDVLLTVDARGAARVEERYLVAPFRQAAELRLLTRPCAGVGSVRVRRSGVAVPVLQERDGPWLVVRDTTAAAGDTLDLRVRYEVRWRGTEPDIPLLLLTTPIPQEDGEREGTVRVRVRLPDASGHVVFPHMARRGAAEWEARYVAIPSFVQVSLGGGEGAAAAACAPEGAPAGSDGGLVWRFLLLVGIMGAWVPLYLAWARRSGDGGG